MKLKKIAQVISLLCIAGPALAQTAPTTPAPTSEKPQTVERITVTGSSIKRVQDESAQVLQVITKAEIERAGITSAEQLLATISANGTGADNLSSNTGIQLGTTDRNNNGNSSANLRGLGAASTLVLLNGRRVSTHGAKGNAVDLNSIPLAAVERVEVLKDGASAIYGTDAIGGVINFILKKDYRGVEVSAFSDTTADGGGAIYRGNILAGAGDLAKDGFNVMASLTFDRNERLDANQRKFVNGFQPSRGLSPDTTGTPFATQTGRAGTAIGASFTTPNLGTGTQTFNRANLLSFQGKCDTVPQQSQYQFLLWDSPGFRYGCAFDYTGQAVLIQPVDRTNFVSRGTMQLNADTAVFVEGVASRSKSTKQFEQSQVTTNLTALTSTGVPGNAYPVGGPFYQDLSAFIPSFNKNLPIAYRWRCIECGKRTISSVSDSYRLLVGAEGLIGKYDYKIGISTAGNKATSTLGDGYLNDLQFNAALATGLINPWLLPGQTQTPAALALINGAKAAGRKLFGGEAALAQFDGAISGELMQLPAGPLAFATGFDIRKESYKFSDGSTSVVVRDAPFDAEFPKVSRNIKAIYAELAIPVAKNFEATLAVRHDRYSDFGGTTNPKFAFKWTPFKEILVRGSTSSGFRAPSFFQLYGATGESPVPGNIADPILCPAGPVAGSDLSVCAIRPNSRQGGNKDLQPEKSKQFTFGGVITPLDWMTASIDYWEIIRTDRIYELTPQQVIANYTTFPENLVRGTDGRLDGQGGYIRAGFVNADGDITRGYEASLNFNGLMFNGKWNAGIEGTYIDSFKSRVFSTQKYTEFVGQWSERDLFVRWKHLARFTYSEGPWSGTVSQSYTRGYKDEEPAGVIPPGFNPDVKAYIRYNLSGTYSGFKNTTISVGIKNLLNTDPPFTAHNVDFAAGAGWDPRVADPRGRAYTARVTYKF